MLEIEIEREGKIKRKKKNEKRTTLTGLTSIPLLGHGEIYNLQFTIYSVRKFVRSMNEESDDFAFLSPLVIIRIEQEKRTQRRGS